MSAPPLKLLNLFILPSDTEIQGETHMQSDSNNNQTPVAQARSIENAINDLMTRLINEHTITVAQANDLKLARTVLRSVQREILADNERTADHYRLNALALYLDDINDEFSDSYEDPESKLWEPLNDAYVAIEKAHGQLIRETKDTPNEQVSIRLKRRGLF